MSRERAVVAGVPRASRPHPAALVFVGAWAAAGAGWFVLLAQWLHVYFPWAAPPSPIDGTRYLVTAAVVTAAAATMVAAALRQRRLVGTAVAMLVATLIVVVMLAVPAGRWSPDAATAGSYGGGSATPVIDER